MIKDVFKWKMSAAMHRSSVYALRDEIIYYHTGQLPMSVSLVLALLPLQTEDVTEIEQRGSFTFNGNSFENSGAESRITFYDPVIGNYYATLPAHWAGTIHIQDGIIEITFENKIEVEIPELANLGVERSMFQSFFKVISSPATTISMFEDALNTENQTWIDADLGTNAENFTVSIPETVQSFKTYDTSASGCGGDPNDPNWFVLRNLRDGLCVVHYGMIAQGNYLTLYGPDTQSKCHAYAAQNCEYYGDQSS